MRGHATALIGTLSFPILLRSHSAERTSYVRKPARARSVCCYRFSGGGRGDYGDFRSTLLDAAAQDPVAGMQSGWASVEQTHVDMRAAVFCVCPPGISQHTLRVYRAIIFGCIPVTFFQAFDRPFERLGGLRWEKFTVNIAPDEAYLLAPVLRGLLARPYRIKAMQTALSAVQASFVWDDVGQTGVYSRLYEVLAGHPALSV